MKNTVCELLHYEVAQYAERKGEKWRLGEGTEIMDALQAHQEMLGVVGKDIPWNLFDIVDQIGLAKADFDSRTYKVLCARCSNIMKITPKELKKALNFYHNDSVLDFQKQIHFKIPLLRWEFSITLWKRGDFRQPKVFIR